LLLPALKSSAQAVFELEAEYNAAGQVALAYKKQVCPASSCSDPIVADIRSADAGAYVAIKNAETAIHSAAPNQDQIETSLQAAQVALTALQNILIQAGVK